MSLRGIWIVSCLPNAYGNVVFSRKFGSVEQRAKRHQGTLHVALPSDKEFSTALFHSLGLDNSEFVERRDSARNAIHLPVLTLHTSAGDLWPVLVMEQGGHLFCCVPDVTENCSSNSKPPLIELPSVSVGFSVLSGIANFLGQYSANLPEKLPQLNTYLLLSLPFGHARDADPVTVFSILSGETATENIPLLPTWKPTPVKGKNVLYISAKEYIRCVQCDHPDISPVVDVYGSIFVKAEVDTAIDEVSLLLSHVDSSKLLTIDGVIIHPCANSSIPQSFTKDRGSGHSWSRKFYFSPPAYTFTLCHYKASKIVFPPILGIYKMRAEKAVKFLLQLKLNENVKNNFEHCEARLPFFHRGPIINLDCKPSYGTVHVNERRNTLIWNIGQKFPSKSLEVSLTATVSFGAAPHGQIQSTDDPFCTGSNAYCSVNFRLLNFTYSGCHIDPKEIHLMPQKKIKLQCDREFQSAEYKIWNTYGQVPYPVPTQDLKLL